MASNIDEIARLLGAKIVDRIPSIEPGYLGASRMAHVVASLRSRPQSAAKPSHQVPLSDTTFEKLEVLAKKTNGGDKNVSPIQLAAELLEAAIDRGLASGSAAP